MENFKVGDFVKFIGCSKEQIAWGNNNDPNPILFVNNEYQVEKIEIHTWHTKLSLYGISGKFNSVCFEKL